MKRCLLLGALALAASCATAPPCPPEPTASRFRHPGFAWARVARVVVLPLVNETAHPQAGEEVRRQLTAELQQLGLFEAVPAPPGMTEAVARRVRDSGRFSEDDLVLLARCGGADVILLGTLGHYSPYTRPRIGLTLHAISPDLGQAVASVDGLWDSVDHDVADRARAWYARYKTLKQHARDHALGVWDDDYAVQLVLSSPYLFGRFVCAEAVRLLLGEPVGRPLLDAPGDDWGLGEAWLRVKALVHGLAAKPCPPAEPRKPAAPPGNGKPAEKKADKNGDVPLLPVPDPVP